jgi:hypothetical protein
MQMARRIHTVAGAAAVRIAAATAAVLAVSPAFGQEADSVTVDVGQCVDIESAEERFACYEAQVDAATKADEAAGREAPDSAAAGPAPAAQTGSRRAGEVRPSSEASRAAEAGSAAEAGDIFGRIGSLRQTVPDAYLITLEDGHVWRQTYPKRYFLRAGDDVRIYPSTWGTDYRLTVVGRSGYIQVEQVR